MSTDVEFDAIGKWWELLTNSGAPLSPPVGGAGRQIVYRVQDCEGRGPFKPGFSHIWADEFLAPGQENLPTWMSEFGDITCLLRKGEYVGSAVRHADSLARWFSCTEQQRLRALGYRPVALVVQRVLAESKNQLVFARRAPLHRGVRFIQWPIESESTAVLPAPSSADRALEAAIATAKLRLSLGRDRGARRAAFEELRRLHAQRSAAQVRRMEIAQGLVDAPG